MFFDAPRPGYRKKPEKSADPKLLSVECKALCLRGRKSAFGFRKLFDFTIIYGTNTIFGRDPKGSPRIDEQIVYPGSGYWLAEWNLQIALVFVAGYFSTGDKRIGTGISCIRNGLVVHRRLWFRQIFFAGKKEGCGDNCNDQPEDGMRRFIG
jgi:hypothetical protein